MGFFFTLLYIVTAYLAPETLFGPLAEYHIEIVIVAIALGFSLLSAQGSGLLTMIQTWAIAGLCAAVACSLIFNHWIGGGLKALMEFLPAATTFFLIVLNFKTKRHLQILTGLLFFVVVFIVLHSLSAMSSGDTESKYLLFQQTGDDTGIFITRMKGLSFLGDPNDLAQFIVALIPCLFISWKKGAGVVNFLFVYAPVAFLVFAMYLTHSRGGMLALMAVAVVAGRRRIGIGPAVLIGLVLFAGLTAAGFSGGRDVSAGEDRIEAWSTGIMLIRSHPLFGVGYNQFTDYNDITAHNTFVVLGAELGLIGLFFWILFMIVTFRNAWEGEKDPNAVPKDDDDGPPLPYRSPPQARIAAPAAATGIATMQAFASTPAAPGLGSFPGMPGYEEPAGDISISDAEIRRLSGLMVVSFAGFLTAGWFLSRAYTMVIYVNAGMAAAVYRMARDRGFAPPPMEASRALKLSAAATVAILLVVYLIVRVDHLMPK